MHFVVGKVRDVVVGDSQVCGGLQHLPLAFLRYAVGRINLVGRHSGLAKLEDELRLDLVRHDSPFQSVASMAARKVLETETTANCGGNDAGYCCFARW